MNGSKWKAGSRLPLCAMAVALGLTAIQGAEAKAQTPPTALYQNGPVVSSTNVFVVFTGAFSTTEKNNALKYLTGLFRLYSGWGVPAGQEVTLRQYGVYAGELAGFYSDPTDLPNAADATLTSRIATLQQQGHVPAYGNELLILFVSKGSFINCSGFHHSAGFGKYYGITYYGSCKWANDNIIHDAESAFEVISSHEIAEFATDPQLPSGWVWQPGNGESEVADYQLHGAPACDAFASIQLPGMITKSLVTNVLDNLQQTCSVLTRQQASQIAATAWASNRLDLVGLGQDFAIWHKAWNGTSWLPTQTTWDSLGTPAGTVFAGPPAAVSWGQNRLDIFAPANGDAFHKAWTGTAWTGWDDLGRPRQSVGFTAGTLAVVSWGANRLDFFGQGTDGVYYHKAWNGSDWVPSASADWESLGGVFIGPPAAVSWGSSRVDVFGEGLDGTYYHKSFNGSTWSSTWEGIGGSFIGPPAAVSWGINRIDVFGQASDGSYKHKAFNGTSWSPSQTGWDALNGKFMGPPAVAAWGTNRLRRVGAGDGRWILAHGVDG